MKKLILFFFIALFSVTAVYCQTDKKPYVLLVSFDAFRHDYVKRYDAPNLKAMIADGIASKSLISTYPSKTFANHYAIISGMYAGNNGLVDNLFYDPQMNATYRVSDRKMVANPAFYGGLPLWQLVQKNGMKSASFFWPGSETKIAGSYPDYWKKYDGKVSNVARIDTVMHWFQLPEKDRPHFVTLYFSLTDDIGHRYGPYSPEMRNAVLQVDSLVGKIREGIKNTHLDIDLIVVSDHGMVEVKANPRYYLTEENLVAGVDTTKCRMLNCGGTHARFYCKDKSYKDELFKNLKAKAKYFKVYKQEDTPQRWHSRNNARVGDVLVVLKPGYDLVSQKTKELLVKRNKVFGNHGYDPKVKDVQGIFYAEGPNILVGKKFGSIENVNVYPFVATLLGIENYPHIDGKKEVLGRFIKK